MAEMNMRRRSALLGAIILILLAAVYAAGALMPDTAFAPDFSSSRLAPSLDHLFGTDWLGRDLLAHTVKGLSVSITVGAVASLVSAVIAALVGVASAMGSRRVDAAVAWLIDLVMGVPHTILVVLISFACGRGMTGLIIGISTSHWTSLARVIRAEVMQLREREFVAVSRSLGKSGPWILVNHMLPHIVPQFVVGLVLMFPHAILHEAAVSFLGFGLPPEQPAIGIILSESMSYISSGMWWPAVFPGAALVCIVLLFDRLGDSLKTLLDPYSAHE